MMLLASSETRWAGQPLSTLDEPDSRPSVLLVEDHQLLAQSCELLAQARRSRRAERQLAAPFEELTPRERQVLAAMMQGKSCETIADAWFVSLATVRTQIRAVLTKLEVGSQLAAVSLAFMAGWNRPA
ncbi:MAG: response regulator containing a CheY-like receiver domain and an DNA-binding domain [Mycobacterium sp.]|jgi:DNA-binding NarL/FixJ family response regulator|nr:response regulator containing a CheY-like receiver domain and an DNA-binding domain [Mycobacterium sp.]